VEVEHLLISKEEDFFKGGKIPLNLIEKCLSIRVLKKLLKDN